MFPINFNLAPVIDVEKKRVNHPSDAQFLVFHGQGFALFYQFKVVATQAGFLGYLHQGLLIRSFLNIATNACPPSLIATNPLTAAQEKYPAVRFKEAGNNLFFLKGTYLPHPL